MCSLGVPKVLGDSSVPGAQRAPLPCFVSDLSADVPGGAAICPAAGGRSGEGLRPRILDAGPRGAPTRPGLPDVSRDLCLPVFWNFSGFFFFLICSRLTLQMWNLWIQRADCMS